MNDVTAKELGSALRVARVAKQLSQEEFANRLSSVSGREINQSYVSRLENGEPLSFERLQLVCEVLQISPSELLLSAEELVRLSRQHPRDILLAAKERVESLLSAPSNFAGMNER